MTTRIFYAGLFYGDYDDGVDIKDIPDGAYILDEHQWYFKNISIDTVDTQDVPKAVLTLNLLLQ